MDNNRCKFEEATIKNYDDYFQIRSEEKNLYWTGYKYAPNKKLFLEFYKKRILDKKKNIYIIYCDESCVGSLNIDYYSNYVFIGYSVKEKFEGKGIATYIVKMATKIIKLNKNITTIKAWVNEKNLGSIMVVKKNGFYLSSVSEIRERFGKNEKYLLFEKNI